MADSNACLCGSHWKCERIVFPMVVSCLVSRVSCLPLLPRNPLLVITLKPVPVDTCPRTGGCDQEGPAGMFRGLRKVAAGHVAETHCVQLNRLGRLLETEAKTGPGES